MNKAFFLALAAASLTSPVSAQHHGMTKAEHDKMHQAHQERLANILADPARSADAKRDRYRKPAETLEFFRVHPDHVIGEYAPGGEWYTRILGRYVNEKGKFAGLFFGTGSYFNDKQKEGIAAGIAKFPEDVAKVTGRPAADFTAFSLSTVPEGTKGTFDRILIMRMMHNMMNWNIADAEIKAMRDLLKADGMIGIEQHRAKADSPFSYSNGSKGYVREMDVIKLMEVNGFELVAQSDANANPKDSADWPDGVWTLPPALRSKDVDKAKFEAIGESDRMTLLFKKRP
ncbi:MAG: methyltransferase [Sphingorhabdus sp.]